MTFLQFALNNIKRNARSYAAYMLSSSFSVMIFFSFAMFIFHPDVEKGYMVQTAKSGMLVAEYIIFFFSFFFIFYSISTFLKMRNKEFGVLMIHGMSKRQLNSLIFTENVLIGLFSILVGIGVGLIFGKLFFMLSGYAMGLKSLSMYIPWTAMILTIAAFMIMFVIVSFMTVLFVKSSEVIGLLKGSQKPKPEPKASLKLSILSAMTIGAGYYMAAIATMRTVAIFMLPVAFIVIVGTYFLFSQLSVYLLKMLKKNTSFYYKRTNMITLSSLVYRMKDNARMFFGVTIVTTVAFCAVGTVVSFTGTKKIEVLNAFPFAFQLTEYEGSDQKQKFESDLDKENVTYNKVETETKILPVTGASKKQAGFIKESIYNKAAKAVGYKTVSLKKGESAWIQSSYEATLDKKLPKSISIENGQTFTLKKPIDKSVYTQNVSASYSNYVIPDSDYSRLTTNQTNSITGYIVKDWEQTDSINEEKYNKKGKVELISRAEVFHMVKQMYNIMLFVGLFIGVVFYLSSVSFLYFRLFSDLEGDRKFYDAVSKIGLTDKEIKKVSSFQIGLLFFVPFVVAAIHTSVAYTALQEFFQASILGPSMLVIGCFFGVHTLYFLIIRSRYLAQLRGLSTFPE
ncbi:putative ABC transport system permease protein [Peribacillus deserti]|uniref:ABC transport system permease protein n=1 Tax=Peribacillus deserti TaxID=673318 RepID=A0ABS2QD96_9BACI|nr:ABC transporter permease [Peribacillus deserti]MBM7691130.1 putative ABC transport system permease protein [Peribacillus deserti]